ncbi:MAG TPA: HlyD family efflux transporter periplasmic adaptor subunit [Steroidobacteraceae bacterium]|nr:HlyD family efflux transporter periplasmic adaptor subunit [Steroidobacteraceae bacterium]
MTHDLFRREAIEARRGARLGSISLVQPLRPWLLTGAALLVALLVAAFLLLGSYTRRSTVTGQLQPALGLATVLAPTAGVVSELHVIEGQHVAAGQLLAMLAVPRMVTAKPFALEVDHSLGGREQGLRSAHDGQLRSIDAQAAGFTAQLAAAREELAQLQAEIATREAQARLDEETLARMRELQERQYVSLLQLRQQESTALEQRGAVQELRRQSAATERSILQLQQSLAEIPGQRKAVEAGTQRDLAALAQERAEMQAPGSLAVAAPVTGVVAAQIVKSGQAVQNGQPLLTLLPGDGTLEAELLVPSRAVGFIAPGDRVLLRYQAYPWQKFGQQRGRVAAISRSALGPAELGALTGTAGGQPLYRVTVALARQSVTAYGRSEALKPGMVLDADILGESRHLFEWLFEPLYSLRGKIGGA